MTDGRQSLQVIEQHLYQARSALDGLHDRMTQINQQMDSLRQQSNSQYQALAKVRLDEMGAQRVVGRLDETDQTVLRLLEQRGQKVGELTREINDTMVRLGELNARREAMGKARDEALAQIDERLGEIEAKMARQPEFKAKHEQLESLVAQAERAQEKASQAQADREEKGKPYETDDLFMYLWERRFRTPDYQGGFLARSLDGWVARIVNYDENRANYHMLTLLPQRLQEHADMMAHKVAEMEKAIDAQLAEAARTGGVETLRESFKKIDDDLKEVVKEIESEELGNRSLLARRAEFDAADDEFSKQAIDLQVSQLKRHDISQLYEKARLTPTPKDDVIVARIGELDEDQRRLERELRDLKSSQRQSHEKYDELEDLRRWYRRRNYDSQWFRFPSGFEMSILLGELLRGGLSGRDVQERIGHQGKFQRRRMPGDINIGRGGFGGGFGGSIGRGGGIGGGGGGFRTGGRF